MWSRCTDFSVFYIRFLARIVEPLLTKKVRAGRDLTHGLPALPWTDGTRQEQKPTVPAAKAGSHGMAHVRCPTRGPFLLGVSLPLCVLVAILSADFSRWPQSHLYPQGAGESAGETRSIQCGEESRTNGRRSASPDPRRLRCPVLGAPGALFNKQLWFPASCGIALPVSFPGRS